jgi:uncharacterized protein (TIGR03067 family)
MRLLLIILVGLAPFISPKLLVAGQQTDKEQLQGTWLARTAERNGKVIFKVIFEKKEDNNLIWVFDGNKVTMLHEKGADPADDWKASFKLNTGKNPKEIEFKVEQGVNEGQTLLGIYELKGEELKLCIGSPQSKRPAKFATTKNDNFVVWVLQRQKPHSN